MNLEEAKTLPLRKEPTMTENIRVVMIENFDYNGCGEHTRNVLVK